MTETTSDLIRTMVLRELEAGVRHDALWLKALSAEKLDSSKARTHYITLRCQALQADVKGVLVKQIRGAVVADASRKNKVLADFLSQKDLSKIKR
jgi:hypothetical protein